MASDVTVTGAANQAARTSQQRVSLAEDFSQFLTLLTTQLQNQDPLSPMDSSEFTNQLVQFSQVEQQINTNAKLDNLVQMQLASISSVALGYVGMNISYISSEMNFDGSTPVDITYALANEATTAKINVYDENDTLVYSMDAPKNAGMNSFTWNGVKTNGEPVAAGTYTVKVDAVDKTGAKIENTTVVTGHVDGIETQNGIVFVLVGKRAVPLANIVNANSAAGAKTADASNALGYVGMDVAYKSQDLKYSSGTPIEINYMLDSAAGNSKINIYDANGKIVYTGDASRMAGSHKFTWNGTTTAGASVPNGDYTVEIEARTTENAEVRTTTFFHGHVNGVETRGGVSHVVMGDISVPAVSVLSAKQPVAVQV